MGQLVRLLIILLVSSSIYVFYARVASIPKTDIGFLIAFILGLIIWVTIRNISMEVNKI